MTWYVVYCGHQTGVFSSWRECHASVNGFKGACYKGYKAEEEALAAYHNQKGAQGPVDQVPINCKGIKKTRQNNLLDQGYYYHCSVYYYLSFIVQVNLIISCNIEPVRLLYEEMWYEWLGWTVAVVTSPNSILRYSNSSRCSQPNNCMFFSAC